jgi:hypothetical protein
MTYTATRGTNDLEDLLNMAEFLAPEVRGGRAGAREAAAQIAEWADRDPQLLEEAERLALAEHHGDSAKILHLAHDLLAA